MSSRTRTGWDPVQVVLVALYGLSFLAAAASAQAERPAWLDDPTADYPPATFLVGVGSGTSTEDATQQARADLAAAIRARVRSVETLFESSQETFSRADATYEQQTRLNSEIEVRTDEFLANVTLGGTWFDEAKNRHHALVYLRRDEAEQIIGADIQACLDRIAELLDCDDCSPEALPTFARARRAATEYRKYDVLCAQLRVVSEGRAGQVDAALGTRIESRLAGAAGELTLRIGSAPEELAGDLRKCLIDAGFSVVDAGGRFIADLDYATSETPYSQPYVFEAWEVSLRIRRSSDGSEVLTLKKNDRAGHKTREAARQRCLRAARNTITKAFHDELTTFLAGGESR